MLLKIDRPLKLVLLQSIQAGQLDTNRIPELKKILNETRPDIAVKEMSDAELDQRIAELERKLKINQQKQPNG